MTERQCQRTFRNLLRRMSRENPLWGATWIHGELLKLGIQMSEAAVSKCWVRHPKLKSQDWRTFLQKHMGCSASVDFFVAPTATFRLSFLFTHPRALLLIFLACARQYPRHDLVASALPRLDVQKHAARWRSRISLFGNSSPCSNAR